MYYVLVEASPRFTVGNVYREFFQYPNMFNAGLWNDDGNFEHIVRRKHLRVISGDVMVAALNYANEDDGTIIDMIESGLLVESVFDVNGSEYKSLVLV